MAILGQDWAADAAAAFGGALMSATITREAFSSNNASDPSGPPNVTTSVWTCDAVAINYDERYVDGSRVQKGDYEVLILTGTVRTSPGGALVPTFVPRPGDVINIPPPVGGGAVDARVVEVPIVTPAHSVCAVLGPGA